MQRLRVIAVAAVLACSPALAACSADEATPPPDGVPTGAETDGGTRQGGTNDGGANTGSDGTGSGGATNNPTQSGGPTP